VIDMAKARARSAARKVKDKWKAKNWYQIKAPSVFDNVLVSETLSESPERLIGRVSEVSMQDLTNDFRKSHIKLLFKIDKVEDGIALTHFKGHSLTSDYLRRMIRRRKSRIDGVYTVETKDGAQLKVKPFAITEKRIQNSQKKQIRSVMKETIANSGKARTLNSFLIEILEGRIGSDIYKNCKKFYPVKRVEIYKTEILRLPTIIIEEEPPVKKEEPKETQAPKEEKKTKKEELEKTQEPEKQEKPEKQLKETQEESKEKKVKKQKPTKKPAAKKTTAKKTKTATKNKTPAKKKTTIKKTKKEK
jgi:small subunit ribosomal protein S3Ae